jgi:pimeloyl-ACP methyl ester carboxylesterase
VIESYVIKLAGGIELSCRATGRPDRPLLVFLHGFPEAAFIWDELLEHFATRFRCVAPNLRGFEQSSAPAEVEAYRAKHLVADIAGLIDAHGGVAEAVIAHDWGGAVAWALAAQRPACMRRLVIVNSPHPATFLRELRTSPAQQSASAYMHFLCRPDAEALLAADDFARLWRFFTGMGAADPAQPGGGWLTEEVKDRYRAVWRRGLAGGCNYYRASPLRPPTGPDDPMLKIEFAPEAVTVKLPTLVVWAERDLALLPALLEGLGAFVPDLQIVRVPEASHWIIHEQPARVAAAVEQALGR